MVRHDGRGDASSDTTSLRVLPAATDQPKDSDMMVQAGACNGCPHGAEVSSLRTLDYAASCQPLIPEAGRQMPHPHLWETPERFSEPALILRKRIGRLPAGCLLPIRQNMTP